MKSTWLFGALMGCSFFIAAAQKVSLLIVDTQGKDAYYYRNLIMLAHAAGFTVDYKNIYDLLEDSEITNYQALFFMLSPSMLHMSVLQQFCNALYCLFPVQRTHAIPEHCLNLLRTFAQQPHKAIGIIVPSIKYDPKLQKYTLQTIYSIGQFQLLPSTTQSFIDTIITHLIEHDSRIGTFFGTSLINRNDASKIPSLPSSPSHNAHATPLYSSNYSSLAQQALPIGLLIHHPHQHNTYLISTASAFTFADINENLFRNPLDFSHRNELLHAAHETLQAFHDAYVDQKIPLTIQTSPLPSFCERAYLQRIKKNTVNEQKKTINQQLYGWMLNAPIACAWLDPYDFFAHEDGERLLTQLVQEKKNDMTSNALQNAVENIALERGIRIIYEANFKLLWFECIPEWYLSPHGIRKEQKDEYLRRMKKIGIALKTFFTERHTPLPKIFIGLNLTSNFKSNLVTNPVQSISGTTYTKIPSPFDVRHFWQPEVLDMFAAFVTLLKDSLPIDGIFFDFEMYHAQEQTGSYTDHMDFSDIAWKTYCTYTKNTNAYHLQNVKDRLNYLQQHKKFKDYFTILEQASNDIGRTIKERMRCIVPHLLCAAYAPTLPSCWFYRGIMAGLSSPSEPLIVASFNTDYQSHRRWLMKHNIHLLHGAAIMLSKLHKPDDFDLIKEALKDHDFVWYNRPSRMIYQYDQDKLNKIWWGIEATPAPCNKIMRALRAVHAS